MVYKEECVIFGWSLARGFEMLYAGRSNQGQDNVMEARIIEGAPPATTARDTMQDDETRARITEGAKGGGEEAGVKGGFSLLSISVS